mmetsp:Transcript_21801/g.74958  ORF Transcript_21801/g.74958 Transcript_21801/m.74958 type:complete len:230 (-) Transcript_21801:1752-2441(-)
MRRSTMNTAPPRKRAASSGNVLSGTACSKSPFMQRSTGSLEPSRRETKLTPSPCLKARPIPWPHEASPSSSPTSKPNQQAAARMAPCSSTTSPRRSPKSTSASSKASSHSAWMGASSMLQRRGPRYSRKWLKRFSRCQNFCNSQSWNWMSCNSSSSALPCAQPSGPAAASRIALIIGTASDCLVLCIRVHTSPKMRQRPNTAPGPAGQKVRRSLTFARPPSKTGVSTKS